MPDPTYTVIVHRAPEGGYWTAVPALPGAGSQAETLEGALEMTREAIELLLEHLEAQGAELPDDCDPVETVTTVTIEE